MWKTVVLSLRITMACFRAFCAVVIPTDKAIHMGLLTMFHMLGCHCLKVITVSTMNSLFSALYMYTSEENVYCKPKL